MNLKSGYETITKWKNVDSYKIYEHMYFRYDASRHDNVFPWIKFELYMKCL